MDEIGQESATEVAVAPVPDHELPRARDRRTWLLAPPGGLARHLRRPIDP